MNISEHEVGQVARRAFDTVAALGKVQTLGELHTAAKTEFARLGFSLALGVHARADSSDPDVKIIFGDIDHPWCCHYRERHWGHRCPVVSAAGPRPKTWDEIRRSLVDPERKPIFDELKEFSLTQGHVVVVETQGQGFCAVSLAGADFDARDPAARTAAHLLSVHYGLRGFELLRRAEDQRAPPTRPRLSQRQVECLRWVRDGKTAWEISLILGLSVRTVEEHLTNARRALGVGSRVQAVLMATQLGLLDL